MSEANNTIIAAGGTVALIGLGNMGHPIGSRWLDAGWTVVGYDRDESVRGRFELLRAETTESVASAASAADIIVLLLPDSTVVDAVISELLADGGARRGTTVIDMSSSDPERTRHNAELLTAHGITLIDAPVSGGVQGAGAGTLTVMVGGEATDIASHRDLLGTLGRVVHVGGVGSAHAAKALNNLLSAVHLWATSEAVLIAERFGIDPETFLEVVNGSSGRSGSSETKWPRYILPGTYDSGFSARLMLKDARIAARLAESLGRPTHLGRQAVEEWCRAVDALPADADHTEIARWLSTGTPAGHGVGS